MKLFGLLLLGVALAQVPPPMGTELACIFETSVMGEINSNEIGILRKDYSDIAQMILDQSPGLLNLNPLKWTHNEQLQQGMLIYWNAPDFDIPQILQARAQILLTQKPFIFPGFGQYGKDAVGVPLVCLAWEVALEDEGGFNIQTRAVARQTILQQKPSPRGEPVPTEMACIFQTDVELETNTDFVPRWMADHDIIASQILEQAVGVFPLPNLLNHTSTDQWRDGMLVYWEGMLPLEAFELARYQILLGQFTFPGFGALLSDASAQPQVCAVWLTEAEDDGRFFITTRANIRSTLLPPMPIE